MRHRIDRVFWLGRTGLLVGILCLQGAELAGQVMSAPEPPPFVATPERLVAEMLGLAQIEPGDVVYDLGSGDGRLVIAAAAIGAQAVGVEYDLELVERSRARAAQAGLSDRTRFHHQDIFQTDVRDGNVVLLYLSADFNVRLRPRLLEQLRPGSRVVSHGFHMGEWPPDSVVTVGSGVERAVLYAWIVPAWVDGFWLLEIDGDDSVMLEFLQSFQRLDGAVSEAGRPARPLLGRMRGLEIEFELTSEVGGGTDLIGFTGSVLDGFLTGVTDGADGRGVRQWRARPFRDAIRPTAPRS